jgi:hypothetical protein
MIESVDCKIDYLTVTTQCGMATRNMRDLAMRVAASLLTPSKSWRMLKYVGWIATSPVGDGGVAYGQMSEVRSITQIWGDLANRWLFDIARDMKGRVTRVDYAVSVLFNESQPPIHYSLFKLRPENGKYTGIIPVGEEGGTLNVGARSSEKFGRWYDKGAQLGTGMPPRVYWRWEVEYKRSCAMSAWSNALAAHTAEARQKLILANVEDFFRKAGLEFPEVAGNCMGYPLVKYATVARSYDRTLQWLEVQVNPALVRLQEAGIGKEACRALGIEGTDCVTVKLNSDAPEVVDLQLDFWNELQNGQI